MAYCSRSSAVIKNPSDGSASKSPSAISAHAHQRLFSFFMAASRQSAYSMTASPSLIGRSSM